MRVLHLIDTLGIGGKEKFTVTLAGYQRSLGIESFIFSMDSHNSFKHEIEAKKIPLFTMPRTKAFDFQLIKNIRAFVLKEKISILHCHNETAAIYGALVNPQGCKTVVTLHNGDRNSYSLKSRIENRIAFIRADKLVAVSEGIASSLKSREFCPSSKIQVIENGIEETKPVEEKNIQSLRKEFSLDSDDIILTCIGRLDRVKNHLGFLNAFAKVAIQIPQLKLILVGDGPLRSQIEDRIQELNLGEKTRITGFRNDIPAFLALTDIFALPSFQEGQSISLLEACSASKAILASDRGGTPSIVSHNASALLIDPENIESMSEALFTLGSQRSLRESLGKSAHAAYQGRFSLKTCSQNYSNLYEQLLRSRRN